ncbi:unnamed protein product, partial [Staurois parvus]
VPLSGLLTHLLLGFHFVIECWADYGVSHCCCQAPNLPWAPVPPPHAACLRSTVSQWVPVPPPIAAVSIATTMPCATFRSPHTAAGFPFCHRLLAGLPLLLFLHPPHSACATFRSHTAGAVHLLS